MKYGRVGVITFSDGRPDVHQSLREFNREGQDVIKRRLEQLGWDVHCMDEPVCSNVTAKSAATMVRQNQCDVVLFNFAVWAFPHFPAIVAGLVDQPIVCFSNMSPQYPGLVAMLAGAGALDQVGRTHARVWGDIRDDDVLARTHAALAAGAAVQRLRGQTYGLIGGRPMGMYTAVSNTDQWMRIFGIDVEHIDQWEIVRRAEFVPEDKVNGAMDWLEKHVRRIRYDDQRLTREMLARQVRSYYAVRELIDEWNLDFCGIKAQPELTNHFCTMDVPEAFLNDPYDWDGPHEPIVCATEADMDGALTMQILKLLAQTPVLFADVRYYHEEHGVFDLVNSGQHATYFAAKSFDPAVNLREVEFYPAGFYFPAGGASVRHIAAPGQATFARLMRKNGEYWMAIVPGEITRFDEETNERLARETQIEWPHAFARFETTPQEFLSTYASNHIHAVYGDYTASLIEVCRFLGIDYKVYR